MLAFVNNAKFHFYGSRDNLVFGNKIYIYSLCFQRKCFCLYKNFSQKKEFLYKNVNNNDSYKRNTMCTFLCMQKAKQWQNVHIYIQKSRHFSKIKTICVTFYSQKSTHFTLGHFHEIFGIGIYIYTKRMTLCVMWLFIFKNPNTSKNQANLRYVLLYTKILTICVTQFFIACL